MEDITHFCPWPHNDCSASSTLQLFDIHENAIFQTICIMSCLFNKVKKKSSGEKRNTIKMNPTDISLLYYFCSLPKIGRNGFEFSLWSSEEEVAYTVPTASAKQLCDFTWLCVLNFDTLCHAQSPCSYCMMKCHAQLLPLSTSVARWWN